MLLQMKVNSAFAIWIYNGGLCAIKPILKHLNISLRRRNIWGRQLVYKYLGVDLILKKSEEVFLP